MAFTVEDVVTRVLAATDVSADRPVGYELVGRWVSDPRASASAIVVP
jgi:hypothetical protein